MSFTYATILSTNFENTSAVEADFSYANLFNSAFRNCNLKRAKFIGANLTNVSFHGANLYQANLTDTHISDDQLHSALSIQETILPNGTRSRDKNLIQNGRAGCHTALVEAWELKAGDVSIEVSEKSGSSANCQFTLRTVAPEAILEQRISLSDKWDSNSWPHSHVQLSARMSTGVAIQLRGVGRDDLVLGQKHLSKVLNA